MNYLPLYDQHRFNTGSLPAIPYPDQTTFFQTPRVWRYSWAGEVYLAPVYHRSGSTDNYYLLTDNLRVSAWPHACGGGLKLYDYGLITDVSDPTRVGEGTKSGWWLILIGFRPHACGGGKMMIEPVRHMLFQTPRVWGGRPGTCVPGHGQDTCDFQQRIPRHARVASATGHQTPCLWVNQLANHIRNKRRSVNPYSPICW